MICGVGCVEQRRNDALFFLFVCVTVVRMMAGASRRVLKFVAFVP